jgi:hypothetical protein
MRQYIVAFGPCGLAHDATPISDAMQAQKTIKYYQFLRMHIRILDSRPVDDWCVNDNCHRSKFLRKAAAYQVEQAVIKAHPEEAAGAGNFH